MSASYAADQLREAAGRLTAAADALEATDYGRGLTGEEHYLLRKAKEINSDERHVMFDA